MDEHELHFPFDRLTRFEGMEDESRLLVDAPALRESYLEVVQEWLGKVRGMCHRRGVDYKLLDTSQPLDVSLTAYLGARQARLGGRR